MHCRVVIAFALLAGACGRTSHHQDQKDGAAKEPHPRPQVQVAPAAPTKVETISAVVDLSHQAKATGRAHTLPDGTKVLRLGSGAFNVGTAVTSLVTSPVDEATAVSGDDQGNIVRWNLETGEGRLLLAQSRDHWERGMGIRRLRFAPGGDKLVGILASDGHEAVVSLDVHTGQVLLWTQTTTREFIAVDPSGKRALVRRLVDDRGSFYKDDSEIWRQSYFIEDLDSSDACSIPMPASLEVEMLGPREFVLAGKSQELGLWATGSDKARRKINFQIRAYDIVSLSAATNGRGVYAANQSGTVAYLSDGTQFSLPSQGKTIAHVADCKDGSRAVLVDTDGVLHIVDTKSAETVARLRAYPVTPRAVALSASGHTVVWVSDIGRLETQAIGAERASSVEPGHAAAVTALSESDGKLVSAGADGTVRLWDTSTGKELETLDSGADWVDGVLLAPGAKRIFAGTRDPEHIVTWERQGATWERQTVSEATGARLFVLGGDGSLITGKTEAPITDWNHMGPLPWRRTDAGAWSEGEQLFSYLPQALDRVGDELRVGNNNSIVRLDLATGEKTEKQATGNLGSVMAWGPGAAWLISGTDTGALLRTEVGETLAQTWRLSAHRGAVRALAISPTGERVLSLGEDGSLALWSAEGELIRRHALTADGDAPSSCTFIGESDRFAVGTRRGRILIFSSPERPAGNKPTSTAPAGDAGADAGWTDLPVPQLQLRGEFALPQSASGAWQRAVVLPGGDAVVLADGTTVVRARLSARADATSLAEPARLLAVASSGSTALVADLNAEGKPISAHAVPVTGKPAKTKTTFLLSESTEAVLTADGTRACLLGDREGRWLDLRRGGTLPIPCPHDAAAINSDGTVAAMRNRLALRYLLTPDQVDLASPDVSERKQNLIPARALFAPDGQTAVFGTNAGTLEVFDVVGRTWLGRIQASEQPIVALAFSSAGDRLSAAAADGRVVVSDTKRNRKIGQLTVDKALALGFSKDGRRLIVVTETGLARSFDVP